LSTQNAAYREVQLLGQVGIDLAPGVYWLGLQNDEGAHPPAQWTSFLAQTLGHDSGPGGDPNPAAQDPILDHSSFTTGTESGDYVQQGADFSIGVIAGPVPASAARPMGGVATVADRSSMTRP
jgi:hypothetical protein